MINIILFLVHGQVPSWLNLPLLVIIDVIYCVYSLLVVIVVGQSIVILMTKFHNFFLITRNINEKCLSYC